MIIDHITIRVIDIYETIHFYEKLGFVKVKELEVEEDSIKFCILENSEKDKIELISILNESIDKIDKEVKEDKGYFTSGYCHIALNVEDIHMSMIEHKAIGLIPDSTKVSTGRMGRDYYFLTDPNGNKVEIIEKFHKSKIYGDKYIESQLENYKELFNRSVEAHKAKNCPINAEILTLYDNPCFKCLNASCPHVELSF